MFTQYKNLPDDSRIWIYQSDRELTSKEIEFISKKAEDFINQWTRHGDDLRGSFTIKHKYFLILAVDQNFNTVSGCSIDSSVRFIKQLENKLQLDLMNKMNISFRNKDNISLAKLLDFKKYAKEKKITPDTIVFNNMIATKKDLEINWEIPAKKSWHKRFLV